MKDLPSYMLIEPEEDTAFKPVPATTQNTAALPAGRAKSLKELEREEIKSALKRHGWVQARAARELGLTQRQIGYKIKKFGLRMPDYYWPALLIYLLL
jgi:Nif-specific regulatory protein